MVKIQPICDYMKRESFKNVVLAFLTLLAMWVIFAVQLHCPILVPSCFNDETTNAINIVLLTLSYSYIAALVFYLVTCVLPSKRRKDILEPIINRKIQRIGRCIRDILLEFSRKTDYGYDVHNTANTENLLRSKNWFAIVPMINEIQKVPITYLRLMQSQGENMKSQISDLIIKYHAEMTASQLVELENLSDASFFNTIDFICTIPGTSIAETGYNSLISDFIKLQEQFLKVEKEFGIYLKLES